MIPPPDIVEEDVSVAVSVFEGIPKK